MSIPSWPELPLPTQAGYGFQPEDPRTKRTREAGPPGYRPRYSSVATTMRLGLDLDRNQREIFWDFYRKDCKNGSTTFTMADPITDNWPLLSIDGKPLLNEAGRPLLLAKRLLCLWGDEVPSETLEGLRFKLTFAISIMP